LGSPEVYTTFWFNAFAAVTLAFVLSLVLLLAVTWRLLSSGNQARPRKGHRATRLEDDLEGDILLTNLNPSDELSLSEI
jgi:hypothetical protein